MRSLKIHLRRLKARPITLWSMAAVPFLIIAPFAIIPFSGPLAVAVGLVGLTLSAAIYLRFEGAALGIRTTILPSFKDTEKELVLKELKSKYAVNGQLSAQAAYDHLQTQLAVKEIASKVDPIAFSESLNFIAETEAWFISSLYILDQLEKNYDSREQNSPAYAKALDLFKQIHSALKDMQKAADLIKNTAKEIDLQEQEVNLPEAATRPEITSVILEVEALKSDYQKDRNFISLAQEEIKRKEMA